LKDLAEEKYSSLNENNRELRIKRTTDFLLQKGFEADFVNNVVAGLSN